MITVNQEKYFRRCNACYSNENVMSISFGSEKATSSISLCSNCREETIKALIRTRLIPSAEEYFKESLVESEDNYIDLPLPFKKNKNENNINA